MSSNRCYIEELLNTKIRGLVIALDISGSMREAHKMLVQTLTYLRMIFKIFNIKVSLVLFSDYCKVYNRMQTIKVPKLSKDEVFILREDLNPEECIKTLLEHPINYLGDGGDVDEAHNTVLQVLRKICHDDTGIIMISDAQGHRENGGHENAKLERLLLESHKLNSNRKLNIVNVNPKGMSSSDFIMTIIKAINGFIISNIIKITQVPEEEYLNYFKMFIEFVNAFPKICLEQDLQIWQLYHHIRAVLSARDPTINDEHSKMLSMLKKTEPLFTNEMADKIKSIGLLSFDVDKYNDELMNVLVDFYIQKATGLISPLDTIQPTNLIGHIAQFSKVSEELIKLLNSLIFSQDHGIAVYKNRPDTLFNALCGNKMLVSEAMVEKLIVYILCSKDVTNELLKKYCLECFIKISNIKVAGFKMDDKWYSSSFGLKALITAIEMIGDPNNLLSDYKMKLKVQRFENLKKNTSQTHSLKQHSYMKCMLLSKCDGGYWIPSNMILPNGNCIYCVGIHENFRLEDDQGIINPHHGLSYHADGTTPLVPTYIVNPKTGILLTYNHIQQCCSCNNKYFIYDTRGLATRKTPLCFACRKGKNSEIRVYTNICMNCNDKYTMPTANAIYVCDTCNFSKWRIENISLSFSNLIEKFPFITNVLLNDGLNLIPQEVTDLYINMNDLIQNLKRHISCDYDNMDYCVIGACNMNRYVELYSMCSFCNLKACKDCIMIHVNSKLDPKYSHGIEDFRCLCNSYIKPNDSMYEEINTLIYNIPDANEMVSMCPDCNAIMKTERPIRRCDDDDDVRGEAERCDNCLSKHIEMLRMRAKESELPQGFYYMKTPCCNILTAKDANTCAHMTCMCRKHWCWLCRSIFERAEHCYEHMRENHDDVEYMHISNDREPLVKMPEDIDKRN